MLVHSHQKNMMSMTLPDFSNKIIFFNVGNYFIFARPLMYFGKHIGVMFQPIYALKEEPLNLWKG